MFGRSVRATRQERENPLPGDELIPAPIASLTNAITILRPPSQVWPWLIQMGAGSRGGWYSYDLIDNRGSRSAQRIVPNLQAISVGALFPAVPGATDGFHVLGFEDGRYLILGWRPAPHDPPLMTWTFVLEPLVAGCTRLIVRARGARGYPFYGLPAAIGLPFVRLAHGVMQRRQLHGIASRAESLRHKTLHIREKTA